MDDLGIYVLGTFSGFQGKKKNNFQRYMKSSTLKELSVVIQK